MSRRALLRRGAVIGAAVWTTPVLQTALAPAAAASVCTVGCAVLSPCTTDAGCGPGLVCSGGICLIPQNGTGCTGNSECTSGNCYPSTGTCIAQWPGTTCTTNSQCLSGKCVGGRCFENPLGTLCSITADCTDNTTCAPATGNDPRVCGGIGAVCANNTKCVSRKCQGGICVAA